MREISLRGYPFFVHDNEDLSNAIVKKNDYWEDDILDYIRDNYTITGTIIDVGANIGNHSIYFARYIPCSYIIAIEPEPKNYEVLVANKNFVPEHLLSTLNIAISDVIPDTEIQLSLNKSNWGAHEVREMGDITVPAYPLDHLAYFGVVELLKIDAEWHEPSVLRSGQGLIKRDKPLILIEDSKKEYGALLPDYSIIMSWEHHNTYLYKWRK